jgi:hypothetical protein
MDETHVLYETEHSYHQPSLNNPFESCSTEPPGPKTKRSAICISSTASAQYNAPVISDSSQFEICPPHK